MRLRLWYDSEQRPCSRTAAAGAAAGVLTLLAMTLAPAHTPPASAATGPLAAPPRAGQPQSRSFGTIDGRPILRVRTLLATAYGPSARDNFPYGAVDYFGQPLRFGVVAVDPSVIPLGTTLYIQGYRDPALPSGGFVARALDEGNAIQGDRIDIFLPANTRTVAAFGVQRVTVDILGPAQR
jgi:3D (Asp-Asp-Asp) domain-containing protein